MILSLWRSSHLLLAITSALFLIAASVTGIILAFEPIIESSNPYDVISLDEVTVGELITTLAKKEEEPISISVTKDNFVILTSVTKQGETAENYIHPSTGETLGSVKDTLPFFNWVTNFHRSLFLKSIGRFFVGFISLLLCFIAITGIGLLAQRQGGFLKLYSKIHERSFNQRYHVILGRWLLYPVIIIALTGVYLSAEKFGLLPAHTQELDWSVPVNDTMSQTSIATLPFFKHTTLDEVREITFPFSEFPEDFYEVALHDREVLVHQYTGAVVSEVSYPFVQIAAQWSLVVHTGQGSILWSIILLVASASILFFIFSGISMFLKRRKKTEEKLVMADKDEAEVIILVGSESGNTYAFAKALFKKIKKTGKSVFLATLNEYTAYENAKHIVVLTATYGDGDAPTNARNFETRFEFIKQPNIVQFSVLGFGSKVYDHFCRYAIRVDAVLQKNDRFIPVTPLHLVDDLNQAEMNAWEQEWSTNSKILIDLETKYKKKLKTNSFKIIHKTELNTDDTFLITLKPLKKCVFQSGDLLEIVPQGENTIRQYSISRYDNKIVLAIKKHDYGVCSSMLFNMEIGSKFTASIKTNKKFHLPSTKAPVIFIGNGTGIGPFLGMLQELSKSVLPHLFWGGKTEESFDIYKKYLKSIDDKAVHLALSRVGSKEYVQDLLVQQKNLVTTALLNNGTIMICGSLAMQNDVLKTLEGIVQEELKQPLSMFETNVQIKTDCY